MTQKDPKAFQAILDAVRHHRPAEDNVYMYAWKAMEKHVRGKCTRVVGTAVYDADGNRIYGVNPETMCDDVLQETSIRAMNAAVDQFFLREGLDKPINDDETGFIKWLTTIANNVFKDAIELYIKHSRHISPDNLPELADFGNDEGLSQTARNNRDDRLAWALNTVLELDSEPYMVLAWIANFLLILKNNSSKHKTNASILAEYENMTLFEMRGALVKLAKELDKPWLTLNAVQLRRLNTALNKFDLKRNMRVGDRLFSECFMSKGGPGSLSDWLYRINTALQQRDLLRRAK